MKNSLNRREDAADRTHVFSISFIKVSVGRSFGDFSLLTSKTSSARELWLFLSSQQLDFLAKIFAWLRIQFERNQQNLEAALRRQMRVFILRRSRFCIRFRASV